MTDRDEGPRPSSRPAPRSSDRKRTAGRGLRRVLIAISLVVLGLGGVAGLGAVERMLALDAMVDASNAWLASLSENQQDEATFEFDSDERQRFHFIPPEMWPRGGVRMGDMNATQLDRAQDLLRSGLSAGGHELVNQIMEVEALLGPIEGPDRRFQRNGGDYWIAIFGEPSLDGTWGWRIEGHHVSLHFTVVEGQTTVSTPTFLGANPTPVPSGPQEGLRTLVEQEDRARILLAMLDAEQREQAIFQDVAPPDIVTGAELEVDPLEPVGVAAADMNGEQVTQLMSVIEAYTSVMDPEIAELRLAKINADGLNDIHFAWAGGTERGDVSYYRIQGPSFLIEFDYTQGSPVHIHTAWRDFEGDLGRDLLREHVLRDHAPTGTPVGTPPVTAAGTRLTER